ncbi:hypothetical protein [Ectopseudomonas oleovorans]|uniref:DNA-binding protein n=1 Tax=Ectopseudomonas oleovorans TaxID=301 RepID=A0AA42U0U5_ECTOL|nr:hypothetical protein [Pseudomonas oleovorans]MDH1341355.1 hypothetical protein [Pseudomonas oleovorans]MDH1493764.1 hypothetical protein [Pseudomonas oleovorans]WGG23156.1 hypothetical protein N5O83_11285 [Pseudomonas oleovorans]
MFPDEKEIAVAVEPHRQLAGLLSAKLDAQHIEVLDNEQRSHTIQVPVSALRLLNEILSKLAMGSAVKVVSIDAELTTQEGADLLNISRPHVVQNS